MKTGRFLALIITAVAASFICATKHVEAAASLYLTPPTGTFIIGNTFAVSIYLNTGGQYVNAVRADLSFPPDKLQIVSPTTGKSFIQVWVGQPTYDNEKGTMKFQGTVPTPGIYTDSGLISTVTFRVKVPGTAVVKFLDSSQVLLNDGHGTDVLGQTTDGIYYLTLPPPQGPTVTSRTNPDQEKWYNSGSVSFEWATAEDVQGYSYTLDNYPDGAPSDISQGLKANVTYDNLADGIYYFHIKALRQGAWGGITDYVVKIDKTPPAAFNLDISPSDRTSNQRPIINFATTDQTSGVDHYELKIIPLDVPVALTGQNSTPFFIETVSPYSTYFDYGNYQIVVRAFDAAGNYYQVEKKLSIVKPFLEIIADNGLRIGGAYTLAWPYVGIIGAILLAIFVYLARLAWIWHRQIEKYLEKGALGHPAIAPKLEELKSKQKEYGPNDHNLSALILLLVFGLGLAVSPRAFAINTSGSELMVQENVPLEPPVVTLFPGSISNDEIFYVGGRAGAPNAMVMIYIQQKETGASLTETAVTDKTGAWFYSLPQFLNAGNYIVWTQLRVAGELSIPSSKMDLTVAPTAIQVGEERLSYQNLYLVLFVIFLLVFVGLLVFFLYHAYHFRAKNRKLSLLIREAEESIRRGFAVLHHDIESELNLIKKTKLNKELSAEEKLREEKLMKDFKSISDHIGKEIWKVEETEKEL